MKRLGIIRRAALIAAAAAAIICQSAFATFAKGTDTNYSQVNGEVAAGARKKYTKLRGKGRDAVTLMVYMIGSDLESRNGMATADLNEMVYSGLNNNKVNVIVETGGCRRWRNSVINAKKLQRWAVNGQGIALLEENRQAPMTDEDELADFIRFCAKKAPADRRKKVLPRKAKARLWSFTPKAEILPPMIPRFRKKQQTGSLLPLTSSRMRITHTTKRS